METERYSLHTSAPVGSCFWWRVARGLQWLGKKLERWSQLAQQRRQLLEMDDHLLKDIGLSRADAERIAGRRWFWDDPVKSGEQLDQRYRRHEVSTEGDCP